MLPTGFEPAILASDRPRTYALDSVATGIDKNVIPNCIMPDIFSNFISPSFFRDFHFLTPPAICRLVKEGHDTKQRTRVLEPPDIVESTACY